MVNTIFLIFFILSAFVLASNFDAWENHWKEGNFLLFPDSENDYFSFNSLPTPSPNELIGIYGNAQFLIGAVCDGKNHSSCTPGGMWLREATLIKGMRLYRVGRSPLPD